jgi:hypothetical protein
MALGVHVNSPDIPHNPSALWNLVAHIFVVADHSVRNSKDIRWHPAHALFHAAADVRQVWFIIHSWEAVSADAIKLFLCGFYNLWKQQHRLHEANKRCSGRVRACLKKRAANVAGEIIGEFLLILRPD